MSAWAFPVRPCPCLQQPPGQLSLLLQLLWQLLPRSPSCQLPLQLHPHPPQLQHPSHLWLLHQPLPPEPLPQLHTPPPLLRLQHSLRLKLEVCYQQLVVLLWQAVAQLQHRVHMHCLQDQAH